MSIVTGKAYVEAGQTVRIKGGKSSFVGCKAEIISVNHSLQNRVTKVVVRAYKGSKQRQLSFTKDDSLEMAD